MSQLLEELYTARELPNYLYPFFDWSDEDNYQTLEERMLRLKKTGIRSLNLMWTSKKHQGGLTKLSAFDTEEYWERIGWMTELCRKHQMTFMLQDAAPFPTGQADGWLERPEYQKQNKLYLAERHQDIKGPNPEGAFLIANMIGAVHVSDMRRGWFLPGDKLLAVIALRREGDHFDSSSAQDLTDQVIDGILSWAVPEGIWRLFVLYETQNGAGRAYYMNLLDPESVALNIQAVHELHYSHLKEEIGKTWLGFFYDETEVGNVTGYMLDAVPGKEMNMEREGMTLPWCRELPELCQEALGEHYLSLLPLLWYEDQGTYHLVRYHYMNLVSRLIEEHYNGQMQRWCRERGIGYLGHNLEDENSHCRLGCGPVHYFRMQAHQDAAGIDLVGNQLLPGKDFTQAWYGCENGDGRFYHYGLAKLASSAAHINPDKQGRSFCEVFAVYGALAGTRLSKFILDHLLVNGINELIPATPYMEGTEIENSACLYAYANRMCHLLHWTKAKIQTALLYHAEAEWYQGDYEMFQIPAQQLAQNQISYDIVPADIFSEWEVYQTDTSKGLSVNGTAYEALILPGAEAIPQSVADFIRQAEQTGFPVFFCGIRPERIAESRENWEFSYGRCVPTEQLAEAVKQVISCELRFQEAAPDIRYARLEEEEGTYYFLHNEGAALRRMVWLPFCGPLYRIDLDHRQVEEWMGTEEDGWKEEAGGTWLPLELAEYEAVLLYHGKLRLPASRYAVSRFACERRQLEAVWQVSLEDGTGWELEKLVNINGAEYAPAYTGFMTYTCSVTWNTVPDLLDLGAVYERCQVYVNGRLAGSLQHTPYLLPVKELALQGKNELRIIVKPNAARGVRGGLAEKMGASTYHSLDPGGLLGPVTIYTVRKM